jgi:hypothetical protein
MIICSLYNLGSFPGKGREWLWVTLSQYQRLFFQGLSGHSMKLTTHIHLIAKLRMHGALPPFSLHISWFGD